MVTLLCSRKKQGRKAERPPVSRDTTTGSFASFPFALRAPVLAATGHLLRGLHIYEGV